MSLEDVPETSQNTCVLPDIQYCCGDELVCLQ